MRRRDEDKIRAIRRHAVEMISKTGVEEFGINKLARSVGISPGTFYVYYKDKEDLLTQLCIAVSKEILSSSITGLHQDMSFAEGLRLQWKNRLTFWETHPLELHFVEQLRYTPVYQNVTTELINDYGSLLGGFIENAIRKQELVQLPFELYWSLAFAPLYQLVKFESQKHSAVSSFSISPQIVEKALDIVLKGLKP